MKKHTKKILDWLLFLIAFSSPFLGWAVLEAELQAKPSVECVPAPDKRERACPECLGTIFTIRVDEINPDLVVGFQCFYCGHFLVVERIKK